jgi:hypothetical protein
MTAGEKKTCAASMRIAADGPARNVGGIDQLDRMEDGGVIMIDNVTEESRGV